MLPLALVFTVAGQNVLLPLDQFQGANRLGGGFWVFLHLVGKCFFLVGDLAHRGAFVIQCLDSSVQLGEFLTHADDFQQCVGLLSVTGLQEAG